MDQTEIEARKKAKIHVRQILSGLADEMSAYVLAGRTIKSTHAQFLLTFRALCDLVACVSSDDADLINGALMERALTMRMQWRELAPKEKATWE